MLFEVKGRQPYATINNTLRVLSRGEQEDARHHTHASALSRRSGDLASIRPPDTTSITRIARGHCTLPLHRRPAAAGSQWREYPGCTQACGGLTRGGAGAHEPPPGAAHAVCG